MKTVTMQAIEYSAFIALQCLPMVRGARRAAEVYRRTVRLFFTKGTVRRFL